MSIKQRILILFLFIPFLSLTQKNRKVGIEDSLRYSLSMSYEAIIDMLYLYDTFLDISVLGYSEFGQSIPLLKISTKSAFKKKPVLLVGNLHAREFYSSKFVLKFCDEFLYSLISEDGIYKSSNSILEEYDLFSKIGYKLNNKITWRYSFNAAAPILPGFSKQKDFVL